MTERPEPATWGSAGFFHLRTPLRTLDELGALGDALELSSAASLDDAALDAALARDRDRLRARLRAWAARTDVREALHVASADFAHAVDAWVQGASADAGLEVALYQYAARAAGRSTPFGLFAGCAVGTVGAGHRIVLSAREHSRRLVELDAGAAAALGDALAATLGDRLVVRPNPGLYEAAGRLRYLAAAPTAPGETGAPPASGPAFRMDAVVRDVFLDAALARARDGATLADVARAVAGAAPDVRAADAFAFVRDLLARGLLLGDLEPALTGARPLDDLIARLSAYEDTEGPRARLAAAAAACTALESLPLGVAERCYDGAARAASPEVIVGRAREHGAVVDDGGARTLQVDLRTSAESAVLGEDVVTAVHAGTLVLQRLFRKRTSRSLADFRQRFVERYEEREVPLLEALDPDVGIGWIRDAGPASDPSPLLAGVAFPAPRADDASLGDAARWLLPRVAEVLRLGTNALHITAADLDRRDREERLPPSDPLPDAYAAVAVLAAESDEAVAAGRFRVLHLGAGADGVALLGRFCGRDAALHERVDAYLRTEEALQPDAIFAEIVYRPEARLGNVARRPLLRAFEIPVLGRSGAPAERQIPPGDLRVSVVDGRVRLRSARLGREVLPRHSSALVVWRATDPPLARFLAALQTQDCSGAMWSWGALAGLPVLPRVVAGQVVLQRARWRIDAETAARLRDARGAARWRVVEALRAQLGVPRHVGLQDEVEVLPLDLENVLAIDALARLAHGGATLVEAFPGPGEQPVRGPEGRFAHELVIPFIRRSPAASPLSPLRALAPVATATRSVPPGGEWCYARIYGGRATADRLLLEGVVPLVREATAAGACDRWFFLRYDDPHDHLRVRLHGDPRRVRDVVLPALHDASRRWLSDGLAWRVQLDTYEREVERYGGPRGMSLSEDVFAADSKAVAAMLAAVERPRDRWHHALLGVHHLLLDFGLDAEARERLLADAEEALGREHLADAAFWARVGRKYRDERGALERLLAAPPPAWLAARSRRLAPVVVALRDEAAHGRLGVPMAALVRAYVHLHVNRALRSSWRAQELLLAGLLRRLTKAERARDALGARDGET